MKIVRNNDAENERKDAHTSPNEVIRPGEEVPDDGKDAVSSNIIEVPLTAFKKDETQGADAPANPSPSIRIRASEAASSATESTTESGEDEYEYVPVSEAFSPTVSKVKNFIGEYYVFLICLVLVGLCFLIINVGTTLPSFFVILAFAAIAALLIFAIFSAWKAKKKAEMDYERGKAIYETVHKNMMEEAEKHEQE